MSVRVRTADDLPGCVTALRAVHEASNYPTAWPADPAGWLNPDGVLACWVAEHGGAIVGQVGALDGTAEPGLAAATGLASKDLILVTRLFVTPAARGLGLARALVEAVVEHGVGSGRRVGLDVMTTSTAAIALYESMGWTLCGTGRATWRTQRGDHPEIRYYLAPS